jgi:hypothetical protein
VVRLKRKIKRPRADEQSHSGKSTDTIHGNSRGEISSDALRSSLSRLQDSYLDTAIEHFEAFAREIGQSATIDYAQKVEILVNSISRITNVLDELTRPAPQTAPELFEQRKDKKENAFQFTLRIYGEYFEKGMSKANIRSLDPKLYQGILNRERRNKDDTLALLTKTEMNDRLLAQFASLAEITASIPEVFRRRLQLYRTLAFRRQQERKTASDRL